jgi:hypothetical protein
MKNLLIFVKEYLQNEEIQPGFSQESEIQKLINSEDLTVMYFISIT